MCESDQNLFLSTCYDGLFSAGPAVREENPILEISNSILLSASFVSEINAGLL